MKKVILITLLLFAALGCSYSNREGISEYPHPFCPQNTISYSLPADVNVCICVYNILGEQVSVIVAEFQTQGIHDVNWEADGFPAGVYFYKLEAGEITATKKMLLLR